MLLGDFRLVLLRNTFKSSGMLCCIVG